MTAKTRHPDDVPPLDVDPFAPDPAQPEDEQEPVDLLALLTIDELNAGSRVLKASIVMALTERTADYERATAVLAWLHARKLDPATKLAPYFDRTFTDVQDELNDVVDRVRQEGASPLVPTS